MISISIDTTGKTILKDLFSDGSYLELFWSNRRQSYFIVEWFEQLQVL
jgi:hypothetical protein